MNRSKKDIPSCVDCDVNGHGVLCALSKENKAKITQNKGGNFYKKGQVIFYEGNHVNGLYCIYDGMVKLSKLGENGKEQIVRFAKRSDILGYRSLLSDEPYQATATAMEDCWVCVIPKERFLNLLEAEPKLSLDVLKLLSQDLKLAEQLLLDISQKSVKERIAEAIILLKKSFGYQNDGRTIAAHLTRSEIADIAGTTTETTIRTLAQLSQEGLIDLSRKSIRIRNYDALARMAGVFD